MRASELVREGQVHDLVYRSQDLFNKEMELIYDRSWVYVGHESEVAHPGDYRLTTMGRDPVILVRDSTEGAIRVLYNRCRHRGAIVCHEESGNANFFRCQFHAWTYKNTGELVGVPLPGRYPSEFDKVGHSLSAPAMVDSYRGFIFATNNVGAEPLVDYLGNARPYLDLIIDAHPHGLRLTPNAHKVTFNGNWKMQLENVTDNYHVTVVHRSFIDVLDARTGAASEDAKWHAGYAKDLGNGHGALEFPDYGPASGGNDFNLAVFPNLAFVGYQVRTIHPVQVGLTHVTFQPMLVPDQVEGAENENNERLRSHELFFGPSAFGSSDDVEVAFNRVQRGVVVGDHWLELSRGLKNEEMLDNGVLRGHITDEIAQRAVYRQWARLMDSAEVLEGELS